MNMNLISKINSWYFYITILLLPITMLLPLSQAWQQYAAQCWVMDVGTLLIPSILGEFLLPLVNLALSLFNLGRIKFAQKEIEISLSRKIILNVIQALVVLPLHYLMSLSCFSTPFYQ